MLACALTSFEKPRRTFTIQPISSSGFAGGRAICHACSLTLRSKLCCLRRNAYF